MNFIKNTVYRRFSSELIEVAKLKPMFDDMVNDISIDEKHYFNIMVSISEAFNNAIKHGNKYDPNKVVVVRAGFNKDILWCRISDQGLGFEPEEIPHPLNHDNLLKESGRGLFLIKELATSSSFRNTRNGYQVDMVFKI